VPQMCHPEERALRLRSGQAQRASRRTKDRAQTTRPLWIDDGLVEAPVYERKDLRDGETLEGPAVVEAYDSTTYVAPGWKLNVAGDLLIFERKAAAA
jgi:N-methylhydantoinase A/oxoprolinase/acetone carboxylase beta subunit